MNTILKIRGQRQRRALQTLLGHTSVSVSGMTDAVGALNPRQTIMELRNQGFRGIICTRRFKVLDRDGKVCRPGEYYIPARMKPLVEEALKENATQASGKVKVAHNEERTQVKGAG